MTLLPPTAFAVPSDNEDYTISNISNIDYIITDKNDTVLVDVREQFHIPSATIHTQTTKTEISSRGIQGNIQPVQSEGCTQVTPRKHTDRETQGDLVVVNNALQQTDPQFKREVISTATSPVRGNVEEFSQKTQTEPRCVSDMPSQPDVPMVNVADRTECTDDMSEVITVLKDFSKCPVAYDVTTLNFGFSGLVPHLSNLRSQLKASDDKVKLMEDAIRRTVPNNLELQESYSKLQTTNSDLEATITELKETTELLEKRLESQLKVMDIQDEGLTRGNVTYQNILRGWRRKVLEMLVEKELNTMCEDRQNLQLMSQNDELQKKLRDKVTECELLLAKQQDMKANLRLKDKVISNMTNEISTLAAGKENQAEVRLTFEEFVKNLASTVTESEQKLIVPTLSIINDMLENYDCQIAKLNGQVQRLKMLYHEKEKFFSQKLEILLTKHTTPKTLSHNFSQTAYSWAKLEAESQYLKSRIVELEHKLNNTFIEKGLMSSQLGENSQKVADLKNEIRDLQERISKMASNHEKELSEQHKRECKAAIHAKHLERKLQGKDEQHKLEQLQLKHFFTEQIEKLKTEVASLKNENGSLRRVLKQA